VGTENVYLKSLREQYEGLKKSIEGLQIRAAEAKRDLTNEELRSVIEQGEKAKGLFTQIEDLSEIELRNAKVASMAAKVMAAINGDNTTGGDGGDGSGDGDGADDGTRSVKLGGAKTQDRDPGFYTRGGQHSFIGDQFRAARMGETAAGERLLKHSRTLIDLAKTDVHLRDVLGAGATTFGAGLVPPVWLAEQFAPVLHRKLRVASVLRQVPWAGPFAWSIPVAGTVAKTSTVAEGVNTTETDPAYGILTVTPKPIMGYSEVSRQMLEGSNPAVDAIIWGDLTGDFYDNAELECIVALNGQANVNTVTVSAGVLTTTDIALQRAGLLDGIAAISDAPAGDADYFVGRTARWTTYLENLEVVTSPTVAASTGFIINSQEHLFSISPPMQFQFEQPAGPALVRVGIWGYEAVTFGRRPKAVTKVTYSGS